MLEAWVWFIQTLLQPHFSIFVKACSSQGAHSES
jgi:hypothetical protein